MSRAVQIQTISHKHQAIADWLIANPEKTQGECAAAFGITQAWLSIVINSDIFQDYLQQRYAEVATPVVFSLREKLLGVAHRAVEKLGTAVDNSQDPEFILAAADRALHRLGYAPAKGPTVAVQNNIAVNAPTLAVDAATLSAARAKYLAAVGVQTQLPAQEPVPLALPST